MIKCTTFLAAGALVALGLTAGVALANDIIVNGDFSANAAVFTAFPGYGPAVTGWTIGGSNTVGINGPGTGFFTTSGEPFAPASTAGVGDFAFIQKHGGNISQVVTTTAGQTYTLTYDAAARVGEFSDKLEVILVDTTAGKQITTQFPAVTDTAFCPFVLQFTAPSASTKIEFLNNGAAQSGTTVEVSDVAVVKGAQPALISLRPLVVPMPKSITLCVNHTVVFDGECVVATVVAKAKNGSPIAGLKVRALVNDKSWCASEKTLPSGVARLLLPLPEVGANVITVRGDKVNSPPVTVQVKRRHFKIITDPRHLIGMEYEVYFGPGYAQWGHEEAEPVLGHYSSLDPRVLRQQTLWFNQMGINFVELDWTNNLTKPFPDAPARESIAANNVLFHLYAHMRQHPKIVFMVGPEYNHWLNHTTPYTGPWFYEQLNYLYAHYINNPKYRNMYLKYHNKPLLLLYLNGPRTARPPIVRDPRFTIRYVGAWLQYTKEQQYGVWSWYDQKATPTFYHGKAEALTVASGYPAISPPRKGLSYWLSPEAGGKNYGETYRAQWRVADKYLPHFLFLCQWNEFEPGDQYNVNLSNDMEPTLMTEAGSHRPCGWGFFYNDLTRREIRRYHSLLAARPITPAGTIPK